MKKLIAEQREEIVTLRGENIELQSRLTAALADNRNWKYWRGLAWILGGAIVGILIGACQIIVSRH